jgi:predicted alpha/beta-fold hydrolase
MGLLISLGEILFSKNCDVYVFIMTKNSWCMVKRAQTYMERLTMVTNTVWALVKLIKPPLWTANPIITDRITHPERGPLIVLLHGLGGASRSTLPRPSCVARQGPH